MELIKELLPYLSKNLIQILVVIGFLSYLLNRVYKCIVREIRLMIAHNEKNVKEANERYEKYRKEKNEKIDFLQLKLVETCENQNKILTNYAEEIKEINKNLSCIDNNLLVIDSRLNIKKVKK